MFNMSCDQDSVVVQSKDKFADLKNLVESSVKSGKIVYVLFFSPACGHCRVFAPIFLSYRKSCLEVVKRKGESKAVMIMVNKETAPDILNKLGITGYPYTYVYSGSADIYRPSRVIEGADEEGLREVMQWSSLSPV